MCAKLHKISYPSKYRHIALLRTEKVANLYHSLYEDGNLRRGLVHFHISKCRSSDQDFTIYSIAQFVDLWFQFCSSGDTMHPIIRMWPHTISGTPCMRYLIYSIAAKTNPVRRGNGLSAPIYPS